MTSPTIPQSFLSKVYPDSSKYKEKDPHQERIMKKTAPQGTWKTPPNQVYARDEQPHYFPPPAAPPPPAPPPPFPASTGGSKMHLMGLFPPKRIPIPSSVMPMFFQPIPPPPTPSGFPSSASSTPLIDQPHLASTSSSSSLLLPSSSLSSTSTPLMSVVIPPPPHLPPPPLAANKPPRKSRVSKSSSTTKSSSPLISSPSAPLPNNNNNSTAAPVLNLHSVPPPPVEDKQKVLEHSRTMARLRRQQQRALTDSLENEYFELCATAAYLKTLLSTNSGDCLSKAQRDKCFQEAFEEGVTTLTPHIPAARSLEMKNLVGQHKHPLKSSTQLPEAHFFNHVAYDDHVATFLACTQGSDKESFSVSVERKKSALLWATEETKNCFTKLLMEDILPLIDNMEPSPNLYDLVCKVLLAHRAGDYLLTPSFLHFPKTDAVVEQFRDTCNVDQINKLVHWSIVNEAQIAQLKLSKH